MVRHASVVNHDSASSKTITQYYTVSILVLMEL